MPTTEAEAVDITTDDIPADIQDESIDESEAPDYGENNKDLPDYLVKALEGLVRHFQRQDQFERRREVLRDRRNRFYERGHQHLVEVNSGTFQAMTPGASVPGAGGTDVQCPSACRDYNIFFPFERVILSILTQNPPGVDFQPDDPSKPEDVEAQKAAEAYRQDFDRHNDVKKVQTHLARMLLVSGRTVSWTRTEENSQKFGRETDGTPRKKQAVSIYGTLESKVGMFAPDQDATPYCILSRDLDAKVLKEMYPEFKQKIKPGPGIAENAYERLARLGVMQGGRSQAQIGDSVSYLGTEQMCFFRPSAFNGDEFEQAIDAPEKTDRNEDGSPLTLRQKMLQVFPDGVRVCFVGEQYVGSWAENLDDHICIGFPYPGDGMHRKAVMDDAVPPQDDFNDDCNAYHEVADYGWPHRWVKGEDQDLDAVFEQRASPYGYAAHKGRATEPLQNEFWQEPDPNIPESLWNRTVYWMTNLLQFILAAPPSLQGDSSPDLKTASAYSQARAQAMGQQGLIWITIQAMFAVIYYQAAKCALRDNKDDVQIVVPNDAGTPDTYKLSSLKGNFGVYPDQDSSFPESTQAKRANLLQIVQLASQNPQAAQQIMTSPDNWELFKDLLGTPDLVIPEAESRDKQLVEIQVLLGQDPIKPPVDVMDRLMQAHAQETLMATQTGAPPPPFDPKAFWKSSVTPQLLDNHEYEWQKCRDYLSSDAARQYEARGGDIDGLENIRLHAMEHMRMNAQLQALMASMMPAPPPPVVMHKGKPTDQPHPTAAPNGTANGAPSL